MGKRPIELKGLGKRGKFKTAEQSINNLLSKESRFKNSSGPVFLFIKRFKYEKTSWRDCGKI